MRNGEKFIYKDILENLKSKIESGYYEEGAMLPKEIELAEMFNSSRQTVRKALDMLKNAGYVYSIKGTGTFVKSKKTDYILSYMRSYTEIISDQRSQPSSIVLAAKAIKANPKVAAALNIKTGAKCYFVDRIRKADEIIMCYERTFVSAELCPGIDKYVTPSSSLYWLYENKYSLKIGKGEFHLEAVNASKEVAEMLKIKENDAVLFMDATIRLKNGKPLYNVEAYYVGSRYIFSTILER